MPISATDLNKAYLAYFGRPADFTGKTYFSTLEQADVIKAFDASAESMALYGSDSTAKINAIYQNLFNRDAEPAGLQYWATLIQQGRVTPAGAAFAILNGAQGTDATSVTNKLAASDAFVAALDTTPEIIGYSGLSAGASARAFLKTVDATPASLTAAQAAVATAVANATGTGTGGSNEAGSDYVLTTAQDLVSGTAKNDFFRAVAGVQVGSQDQTTLNSSDIIDGSGGNDTLVVNMTGTDYRGGARIKSIETLQIGTNLTVPVTFDYNVNAGFNEISDTTKIVYDQINVNETLTVSNILKTGTDLPTLAWVNEAGSAAGIVNAAYRASATAGDTTQKVELMNVNAVNTLVGTTGVLNIGAGVETLTIASMATAGSPAANTLNSTSVADGLVADLVSVTTNDGVADNGALTKVIVTGTQAFGRAAGVITTDAADGTGANFGLTNRAVGSDLGLAGVTNGLASASNLISVAGTVTEIDATAADGGVAMRFVGRADNGAVNVTFKGGKAADYIEFERGNINASGGEGADTFAFINDALTSYDFGSADTIVGGVGVDTIQLGVNGVVGSAVVANTTEFNNKTGIDVLDLRGNVNNVTLADAFVAAADAGTFTVRTDKIVQTSGEVAANATPSLANNNRAAEDNSVNTIVLTELADNRAIKFIGGSGKDQVVVDNASANQFTELDGGSNTGTAATGTLGFNDSLTVVNTSVLDDNDVKNIKNFEFVNLVETIVGNSNFTVTLSEAFVLGNANGLVIGSTTGTFGNQLGATDVVNLEVSDLFNTATGQLKTSLAGRTVNIQDVATKATVNYLVNGVPASVAQIAALEAAFMVRGTAPAATILDDVPGAAAIALPAFTFTAGNDTFAGAAAVNDNVSALAANVSAADTVSGGVGGSDTITMGDALLNVTLGAGTFANVTGFENIVLGGAANIVTLDATTTTVTGSAGTDVITLVAATNNINLGAGNDTLIGAGNVTVLDTLNGGAGSDTLTLTSLAATDLNNVTGFETISVVLGVAGAATTVDALVAAGSTLTVSQTGAFALTFNGAAETDGSFNITSAGGADVITGGALADVISTAAGTDTITGGGGNDTITSGAGNDVINFVSALTGGMDTITDFVSGGDKLSFSKAGFAPTGAAAALDTAAAVPAASILTVLLAGAAGTNIGGAGTANDVIVWNAGTVANAGALNVLLAAQAGSTAAAAFIVYTNSTTGATTVAFDGNLADASNAIVDVVQLTGVAATSLVAGDFNFVA